MRLHPRSAILTLVGEGIDGTSEIAARTLAALKQIPVTILSSGRSKLAVSLMVPSTEMQRSVEMLHREFFQQIDPAVFAECQARQKSRVLQYLAILPSPSTAPKDRTTISSSQDRLRELRHGQGELWRVVHLPLSLYPLLDVQRTVNQLDTF